MGSLVGSTAVALVGTAFSPYLAVEHPLLLLALSPEAQNVLLVSEKVPWAFLIPVVVLRRVFGHAAAFGFGGLYGDRALRWTEERSPRLARFLHFVRSLFERFGLLLVAATPAYSLSGLAGAAGSRPLPFLLAITLGQVAWVTLNCYFGALLVEWSAAILAFFSAHLIESTAVAASLVALQQLYSRWQNKKNKNAQKDEQNSKNGE